MQKTADYLYVHKQQWNRGGIDITFGDNKYFAGILIRGIKYNDYYFSGSATVKKEISRLINPTINQHKVLQDYFEENTKKISLIEKNINNYNVFHSTRIGLNKEKDIFYANALYRFIREDYLNETNKDKFKSYTNLKERTKIKAISKFTLNYQTTEQSAIEAVESDDTLNKSINLFNSK